MNSAVDDEKPVALGRLVSLAQQQLHGDSPLSDEAGFAGLEARMPGAIGGRSRQRALGWIGGALALGGAAALAGVLVWAPGSEAITFEVAGGLTRDDGSIVGARATKIQFSDGSEALLARGAEARVEQLTGRGGRVVLKQGGMHVKIAKSPQAAWTIGAGPYDVKVTGTAFDVSWSSQSQAFDVRMQSGAVVVTGPLAFAGIPLSAGQHLFGGVAEGRLTVEGNDAAQTVVPAVPTAREPAPGADPPSATPSTPSVAPRPSTEAESHTWTKQVAEGHFGAVLAQAEQRGLERTLASGSLAELAALADAARYAGRPQIAKRVLLAQRQRFASSPAARDAAFFLGRIAEDSGGGATEWYERYVAESPQGPYASQAFGRKMMLSYAQRGAAGAKPGAAEYLSRYPNGPYAAAARKITEESTPTAKP